MGTLRLKRKTGVQMHTVTHPLWELLSPRVPIISKGQSSHCVGARPPLAEQPQSSALKVWVSIGLCPGGWCGPSKSLHELAGQGTGSVPTKKKARLRLHPLWTMRQRAGQMAFVFLPLSNKAWIGGGEEEGLMLPRASSTCMELSSFLLSKPERGRDSG